jgi:hypothetical protein
MGSGVAQKKIKNQKGGPGEKTASWEKQSMREKRPRRKLKLLTM